MAKGKSGVSRRGLLAGAGTAVAGLATQAAAQEAHPTEPPASEPDFAGPETAPDTAPAPEPPPVQLTRQVDWQRVRSQWDLDWSYVNLAAMLFASNPRPVKQAIARHRDGLDANPVMYLEARNRPLQNAARTAAAGYFGTAMEDVALVESTTAGIGLVYAGLRIGFGEEILTTHHDYYVTHEALRLSAQRSGAMVRKISLFDAAATATRQGIVARIIAAITPKTRALALTWVHSSTGLKMPIADIAAALRPINAIRPPEQQVLLIVDGVHGFGVENTTLPQLGCDVLVAGCHKWMFGPRGTGVVFARPQVWNRFGPTIPTFLAANAYGAWLGDYDPGPTTGARMTPGGFKAFEHVWSLTETFGFHQWVGKQAIQDRTLALASRLKTALIQLPQIALRTPLDPGLSAGIVSFDVRGRTADQVVHYLRERRVIGSAAPYARRHVRLTPSFRNSEQDVDFAVRALADLR